MRVYVAVSARHATSDLSALVEAAAARCLPFRPTAHDRWLSPDGRTVLAAWSNEPDQPDRPLLLAGTEGARGFSGDVRGAVPPLEDLLGCDVDVDVGGVWSMFAARADHVAGLTCASGAEAVFHAATADLVVIGNRALLVHLVARPDGPVPDAVGLAGVLATGYCVTDRTAYDGVRSLDPGTRAVGAQGRVEVGGYGEPGEHRAVTGASDVAAALVESVAPLRDLERPVRLGLTGGRDSRLLVALLTKVGVPVATHTAGLPGDPDVVVASEVAAVLGVDHTVVPPKGATVGESSATVDVRARLREAVVLGEGMLSAYDRTGRVDARYNATTVPFAGSGGEILRAYYAGSLKDLCDADAVRRAMRSRLKGSRLLVPQVRAAYESEVQPWLEAARRRGAASLEDFYVRQRTGRWTGVARGSASIGSLARRPYLDHRVVRAVRGVPLQVRADERLVAEVLDELAPELAGVRFAGRRWKFDEQAPTGAADLAAWERRAPVRGAHGDEADFNWRTDLPEVRAELAAVVLGAPAAFWRLVDRARVTELVGSTEEPSRSDTMRLWHLATVAEALTHDFYVGEARFDATTHEVVASRPVAGPRAASPRSVRRVARSAFRRVRDALH